MSSGKGGSIQLSAEALAALELAAAKRHFEAAQERARHVSNELEVARRAHGVQIAPVAVPSLPRTDDASEIRKAAEALGAQVEAALGEVRTQVHGALLASVTGQTSTGRSARVNREHGAVGGQPVGGQRTPVQQAQQVMHSLSSAVPLERLEQLGQLFKQVEGAPAVAQRAALANLELAVNESNRLAQSIQGHQAVIAELRSAVSGLSGAERVEFDLLLDEVQRGTMRLTGELRNAILSASNSSKQSQLDAEVAGAIASRARALGYRVQEGFVDLLERGEQAHIVRPEWESHAASWRIKDGSWEVVHIRTQNPGQAAIADRAAQDRFCVDYERIVAELAGSGISLVAETRIPVGVAPSRYQELSEVVFESAHQVRDEQTRETPIG